MIDYSKQCWACGKNSMFPIRNYYECTECGATWNDVLGPVGETVILERDPGVSTKGQVLKKGYSPSHRVKEAARKAREAKEVKTQ